MADVNSYICFIVSLISWVNATPVQQMVQSLTHPNNFNNHVHQNQHQNFRTAVNINPMLARLINNFTPTRLQIPAQENNIFNPNQINRLHPTSLQIPAQENNVFNPNQINRFTPTSLQIPAQENNVFNPNQINRLNPTSIQIPAQENHVFNPNQINRLTPTSLQIPAQENNVFNPNQINRLTPTSLQIPAQENNIFNQINRLTPTSLQFPAQTNTIINPNQINSFTPPGLQIPAQTNTLNRNAQPNYAVMDRGTGISNPNVQSNYVPRVHGQRVEEHQQPTVINNYFLLPAEIFNGTCNCCPTNDVNNIAADNKMDKVKKDNDRSAVIEKRRKNRMNKQTNNVLIHSKDEDKKDVKETIDPKKNKERGNEKIIAVQSHNSNDNVTKSNTNTQNSINPNKHAEREITTVSATQTTSTPKTGYNNEENNNITLNIDLELKKRIEHDNGHQFVQILNANKKSSEPVNPISQVSNDNDEEEIKLSDNVSDSYNYNKNIAMHESSKVSNRDEKIINDIKETFTGIPEEVIRKLLSHMRRQLKKKVPLSPDPLELIGDTELSRKEPYVVQRRSYSDTEANYLKNLPLEQLRNPYNNVNNMHLNTVPNFYYYGVPKRYNTIYNVDKRLRSPNRRTNINQRDNNRRNARNKNENNIRNNSVVKKSETPVSSTRSQHRKDLKSPIVNTKRNGNKHELNINIPHELGKEDVVPDLSKNGIMDESTETVENSGKKPLSDSSVDITPENLFFKDFTAEETTKAYEKGDNQFRTPPGLETVNFETKQVSIPHELTGDSPIYYNNNQYYQPIFKASDDKSTYNRDNEIHNTNINTPIAKPEVDVQVDKVKNPKTNNHKDIETVHAHSKVIKYSSDHENGNEVVSSTLNYYSQEGFSMPSNLFNHEDLMWRGDQAVVYAKTVPQDYVW